MIIQSSLEVNLVKRSQKGRIFEYLLPLSPRLFLRGPIDFSRDGSLIVIDWIDFRVIVSIWNKVFRIHGY